MNYWFYPVLVFILSTGSIWAEPRAHEPDSTRKRERAGEEIYAVKPLIPFEEQQEALFKTVREKNKRLEEIEREFRAEFSTFFQNSRALEIHLDSLKKEIKKPVGIPPAEYKIFKEQTRALKWMKEHDELASFIDHSRDELARIAVGKEWCYKIEGFPDYVPSGNDQRLVLNKFTNARAEAMFTIKDKGGTYYTLCTGRTVYDKNDMRRSQVILHFDKDHKLIEVFSSPQYNDFSPKTKPPQLALGQVWEPVAFSLHPLKKSLVLSHNVDTRNKIFADYTVNTDRISTLHDSKIQNLTLTRGEKDSESFEFHGTGHFGRSLSESYQTSLERTQFCEKAQSLRRAGIKRVIPSFVPHDVNETMESYLKQTKLVDGLSKLPEMTALDSPIESVEFRPGKEIHGPFENGTVLIGEDTAFKDVADFLISKMPKISDYRKNLEKYKAIQSRLRLKHHINLSMSTELNFGSEFSKLFETLEKVEATLDQFSIAKTSIIEARVTKTGGWTLSDGILSIPVGVTGIEDVIRNLAPVGSGNTGYSLAYPRETAAQLRARIKQKEEDLIEKQGPVLQGEARYELEEKNRKTSKRLSSQLDNNGYITDYFIEPERARKIYAIVDELLKEGFVLTPPLRSIVIRDDLPLSSYEIVGGDCKPVLTISSESTKEQIRYYFSPKSKK